MIFNKKDFARALLSDDYKCVTDDESAKEAFGKLRQVWSAYRRSQEVPRIKIENLSVFDETTMNVSTRKNFPLAYLYRDTTLKELKLGEVVSIRPQGGRIPYLISETTHVFGLP